MCNGGNAGEKQCHSVNFDRPMLQCSRYFFRLIWAYRVFSITNLRSMGQIRKAFSVNLVDYAPEFGGEGHA